MREWIRARFDRVAPVSAGVLAAYIFLHMLPDIAEESPAAALVASAALALHVLQANNRPAAEATELFDGAGRYVLATAPVAGLALDVFLGPPDPRASALLSAFVSGILLLGLFRDELGQLVGQRRFGLFLLGLAAYGGLLGVGELLR